MPLLLLSNQPLKLIYAKQKKKSLKWLRNSQGQPKTPLPFTSQDQSCPAHSLGGLAECRTVAPTYPHPRPLNHPAPSSWKASIQNSLCPLPSAWQGSASFLETWRGWPLLWGPFKPISLALYILSFLTPVTHTASPHLGGINTHQNSLNPTQSSLVSIHAS